MIRYTSKHTGSLFCSNCDNEFTLTSTEYEKTTRRALSQMAAEDGWDFRKVPGAFVEWEAVCPKCLDAEVDAADAEFEAELAVKRDARDVRAEMVTMPPEGE